MNLWASSGLLRSSTCAAGTLPGDIDVWEEKSSLYGGYVRTKACRVSSIPGPELRIFKDAVLAAPVAVQVSGAAADNWNGTYLRQVHPSCPTRHASRMNLICQVLPFYLVYLVQIFQ